MGTNIAINGFGRIGKTFLRALLQDDTKQISVVAINLGPSSPEHLEHFFKYDSLLGTFEGTVTYDQNTLTINEHKITIFTEIDPTNLPWGRLDIDWVVEASGRFVSRDRAQLHIDAGAKKVLITAPAKGEDITLIPGVNDESYDPNKHTIVSLGSCTTNCFAPIVKVILDNFALTQGMMTTVHAYTNNQALLDSEHKDPRRGRAAAINIIPTSTGADKVITKIYPELQGKLKGIALRVPVPTVSLLDFTWISTQEMTVDAINQAFEKAAQEGLKGILDYSTEPLVSSDLIGSPFSCIIDGQMTQVQDAMGKVFGWYDNEFGYSCRLKDFLLQT